ncbi:MAG: hypothetical protein F2942_10780 [Actinobacteria bacterium]|uniref:Unannotated protein n=1 Tax=freshwater metagenome TaxID=449393 RepID=A0A6J7UY70_9ZZZZ|nr:hypothetical protein [Actinomycetota bacterium]
MTNPDSRTTITRLIGVYDADGTLRGELAYWVGARLGRTHCSLCEITHGLVKERSDWKSCKEGIAVPFDTYHRNDQPSSVRSATGDTAPVVVAETTSGITVLLGSTALDSCGGSVDQLIEMIEAAVLENGLEWPNP